MKKLLMLLFSRLLLFLGFQSLFALVLSSWGASTRYWILSATLANVVSVVILMSGLRHEGATLFSLLRFQKATRRGDLAWLGVMVVLSVPVAIIPSLALSTVLWGNAEYYHQVLFQAVDRRLLLFLLVAYPLTTALAEYPTYFGYIMPRLEARLHSPWQAVALSVMAFSLQHCTLPLVLEAKFIFFRGTMYLLYAVVYGCALHKRPSLLPWLSALQAAIYVLPVLTTLDSPR